MRVCLAIFQVLHFVEENHMSPRIDCYTEQIHKRLSHWIEVESTVTWMRDKYITVIAYISIDQLSCSAYVYLAVRFHRFLLTLLLYHRAAGCQVLKRLLL